MNNCTKFSLKASLTRYLALSLGLSITGLSTQSAHADSNWVGGTSTDWNDGSNWGSGFPSNTNAIINTNTGNIATISATPTSGTPTDIKIGNNGTGRLDQTAGTAGTGNGNWMFVGANNGNGTFNLAQTGTAGGGISGFAQGTGSFSSSKFWIGGADFNDNGTGTVNINTSGTITTTDTGGGGMILGGGWNGGTGNATVNLESGTINVGSETWVGRAGTGVWNQTGGTVNSTSYFVVGREKGDAGNYTAGNGTVNLSGGTINAATGNGITSIASSGGATGVLNVSGSGVFNSANGGMVVGEGWQGTNPATGTLNVSGGGLVNIGTNGLQLGAQAIGNGTVNLNGGTIQAGSVFKGAGTGNFNFNGGTLKATGNNTAFMTGLTSANVLGGGAVINSNGFDVTIGQALLSGTAGDGGLTKTGAGALSLTGASTYTGSTTINGGTLRVNTVLTSSTAVLVNSGALAGSGTVGNVTVTSAAGAVSNGTGSGNTTALNIGSLTFGSAGSFSLNKANDTSTVALSVTGTLTTIAGVSLNVATAPTWSNGSTYNMISYGSLSGTNPVLGSIAGLGARQSATVGNTGATNGFITLAIAGDTPFWTGAASSAWTTGTIGSPKNWKLVTANTTTDFLTNDQVLFNDNATGTTSVDISTANVGVASVTFTNNTKNYTILSSGGFGIADGAGAASLVKSGTGALVITTSNSYTGATTINAGATLALGNGTSGNDGTIANTSNVSNDGTLVYNRFGSSTAGYLISGTGSVVKNGAGTQILGGANTYSGGTLISGGTLQITTTAGAANLGTFNLNGGAFQTNVSSANYNYAPTINLTAAGSTFGNVGTAQVNYTGTINGNNNALTIVSGTLSPFYINGTLNNVSQINIQSGLMGFDQNNVNNRGTAPVSVANGAALWYAGNNANPVINDLTFNGGNGLGGGALYYEGGTPVPAALTGNITLASGTTGIGTQYANDTITLNGNITGPGALTQLNATVILAGSNSYSGVTTINAGTLQLGNGGTSGSLLGSTAITNNGTLAFNRSNTITQGTDFGTIGGTGGVTVQGGGTVVLNAANSYTGTTFIRNGTMQVSGTINSPASNVSAGEGNLANGTMNVLSGGSVSGDEVWFGNAGSPTNSGTGVGTVAAGGVVNSSRWMVVGRSGTAGSIGTLTLNGGTLNIKTGGVDGNLEVAVFDGVSGTLNINTGSINLFTNGNVLLGSQNTTGNGTVNQIGGTVTFYSDAGTTVGGSGAVTLGAGSTSGAYTYNLNGGTLIAPKVNRTSGAGSGTFNFNGGTLKAAGASGTFMQGLTRANVRNNGALINSNGFDVTINQALAHSNIGGDNATDGGLTKTGNGTLTLTASNTYTGATNVNNGAINFGLGDTTVTKLTSLNIATTGTAAITQHTIPGGGSDPEGSAFVKVLDTKALNIAGNGVLDMTNNAMIVRGGTDAVINALVTSGFNSFSNNGPGINSSTAAGGAPATVGELDNSILNLSTWEGISGLDTDPNGAYNQILVKYTWYGDANLDGTVTPDDYLLTDAGASGSGTGWLFGDFNYDGTVSPDDYLLIDAGSSSQDGSQFTGGTGGKGDGLAGGAAAVPEPGTWAMLVGGLGMLALCKQLGRRKA